MAELNKAEILRYSRHLVMPEVGSDGQQRLKSARVLCIGAGGLGSPAALYLAAAGVGTLGIAEFDTLDSSNLQRQILYQSSEVGSLKLDAARSRLAGLNPEIEIRPHPLRLDAGNVDAIFQDYDVVVDGSDNFATRYLVNDACVNAGIPDVHASVLRFEGQLSVFDASRGPCLRCLFPEPPPGELVPSCSEGGVMGAVPGVLGSLQALEAIKLVLGVGEPLIGKLLLFDGLGGIFRELPVARDPQCRGCAGGRKKDYEVFSSSWASNSDGANTEVAQITPRELATRLREAIPPLLLDVRQPEEFDIAHIPNALLVPLNDLEGQFEQFDSEREYVIVCHHGARSERAYRSLLDAGMKRLAVLSGGIDAWACEVDTSMARY